MFSFNAYAAGFFDTTQSSTITLPSTLTLPVTASVGDVVYSTSVTNTMRDGGSSSGTFLTTYLANSFAQSDAGGDYVYNTNIDGLGFRLRGNFNTYYQTNILQYFGDDDGTSYKWYLSTSTYIDQSVYLELIVTSPSSLASGTLDLSSVSAQLLFNPRSSTDYRTYWKIYLSGTTEITANACEVNSYDSTVDLGEVYTAELNSAGTTSNNTPFKINLTCREDSITPSVTFSSTVDSDESTVFKNTSGTATGVGVQLLYNDNVITPNMLDSIALFTFFG